MRVTPFLIAFFFLSFRALSVAAFINFDTNSTPTVLQPLRFVSPQEARPPEILLVGFVKILALYQLDWKFCTFAKFWQTGTNQRMMSTCKIDCHRYGLLPAAPAY